MRREKSNSRRVKSDSKKSDLEKEREEINKIWVNKFTGCYSTVIHIRRYCNSIAKKFAIRRPVGASF